MSAYSLLPVSDPGLRFSKVAVAALQHLHAVLIVDGGAADDDPCGAPGAQFGDGQRRVQRVPGIDRGQKLRRRLQETDHGIPEDMRQDPGPRRRLRHHLQPVRQQAAMAVAFTVFDVVVDRVIVPDAS